MKKSLGAALVTLLLSLSFVPSQAEAAGMSLSQRQHILFLRVRLERRGNGAVSPVVARRLVLQLTRLAPGRAAAWLLQGAQKVREQDRVQFVQAIRVAQISIVKASPLLSPRARKSVEKKVNQVAEREGATPTPTPTPYQA